MPDNRDKVIKLVVRDQSKLRFVDSDGVRWSDEAIAWVLLEKAIEDLRNAGVFEIRVHADLWATKFEPRYRDTKVTFYVLRSEPGSCPACGGKSVRWRFPGPPFQGTCLKCEHVWESELCTTNT